MYSPHHRPHSQPYPHCLPNSHGRYDTPTDSNTRADPNTHAGACAHGCSSPVAEWTHQFGSPALDRGNALALDGEGNIIIVGATQGALPGQTSAGSWDAFVRKYSPDGTELWTHQFGSPAPDVATRVAVDGMGNIIVAGSTMDSLPGQTRAGYDDAFVRKLSPEGSELWTRQFGSSLSSEALGVAVDGMGNIIVAGRLYGALPGQTPVGQDDAFLREFSPEGVWSSGPSSSAPLLRMRPWGWRWTGEGPLSWRATQWARCPASQTPATGMPSSSALASSLPHDRGRPRTCGRFAVPHHGMCAGAWLESQPISLLPCRCGSEDLNGPELSLAEQ